MAKKDSRDLFHIKGRNDEFLATLLHDIKSPMLSISLALEGKLDDELLSDIYNINLSTLQLVENLLYSYSFDDSAWHLSRINTDIRALLEGQLLVHKYLLKEKNLKVRTSGFDSAPRVVLCPACIERVFSNLLSNAHKYSPQDSEITICAKLSKKMAEFKFTNYIDGQGAKLSNQIFEKFNTSGHLGSQGLGLYICKKMLEEIGGSIAVENGGDQVSFCVRVNLY